MTTIIRTAKDWTLYMYEGRYGSMLAISDQDNNQLWFSQEDKEILIKMNDAELIKYCEVLIRIPIRYLDD